MLNFIRKHSQSWFAKIILLLVIASFGIWGVGDFSRQNDSDITIAVVGDKELTKAEVFKHIQNQLQRFQMNNLSPEILEQLGIVQMSVQFLINELVLKNILGSLNFYIPDEVVMQDIVSDPTFQIYDRFSEQTLKLYLKQQNISEDDFIDQRRFELSRNHLTESLLGDMKIPNDILVYHGLYSEEKRIANILTISANKLSVEGPSQKDISTYYEKYKNNFMSPEYRKLSYILISPLDKNIQKQVSSEQIKAFYQENIDMFKQEEQRKLTKFTFPSKKEAESAFQLLKKGHKTNDINKLVDEHNLSNNKMGWVGKSDLTSLFADTVFSLQKNELSQPIKAIGSWQIFFVEDSKKASTKQLDDVKELITIELALDHTYEIANQVDQLIEDGKTLSEISQQLSLKLEKTPYVSLDGTTENGKDFNKKSPFIPEIIQLAYDTDIGETSFLVESQNPGAFFITHVENKKVPKLKTIDQVQDQIIKLWTLNAQKKAASELQKNILSKLEKNQSIDKLINKNNIDRYTTSPFKRDGTGLEKQTLPLSLIESIFSAQKGKAITSISANSFYVATVSNIQLPSYQSIENKIDKYNEALEAEYQNDMMNAFGIEQKSKLNLQINNEALQNFFSKAQ